MNTIALVLTVAGAIVFGYAFLLEVKNHYLSRKKQIDAITATRREIRNLRLLQTSLILIAAVTLFPR